MTKNDKIHQKTNQKKSQKIKKIYKSKSDYIVLLCLIYYNVYLNFGHILKNIK